MTYLCGRKSKLWEMQTRQNILDSLKKYKSSNAKRFGIDQLGVFGSVARGEQTETSDVDVCLGLTESNFFTRMTVKEDLEQLLGCPVDVISLNAKMRPLFKQNLLKDAIFV